MLYCSTRHPRSCGGGRPACAFHRAMQISDLLRNRPPASRTHRKHYTTWTPEAWDDLVGKINALFRILDRASWEGHSPYDPVYYLNFRSRIGTDWDNLSRMLIYLEERSEYFSDRWCQERVYTLKAIWERVLALRSLQNGVMPGSPDPPPYTDAELAVIWSTPANDEE